LSRILEFQPMDEQTVVSRVLIELHQAIDDHFPEANPSGRQFTKTVLTNQSDATRADNVPSKPGVTAKNESPQRQSNTAHNDVARQHNAPQSSQLSMTPKTGLKRPPEQELLHTADIRRLIGDSRISQVLRIGLLILLLTGIGVGIWLVLLRGDI
jgi:hypothetical protein